jgi:flagellar hook-associated protein FlgK
VFRDNTNIVRTFPFTSTLTVNFSNTLQVDSSAIYRVFFTNDDDGDDLWNDFGTPGATIPRTNLDYSTVSRLRDNNFATITASTVHGFVSGDVVEVFGISGDTDYNGVYVVTSATTTSFTYPNTAANEAETPDTGAFVYRAMGGLVDGEASIQFGYDYDTNDQRGAASAGEIAPITVVAIGLANAQYVLATGTIDRTNANIVTLTAPTERNYANPA